MLPDPNEQHLTGNQTLIFEQVKQRGRGYIVTKNLRFFKYLTG